MTIRITYNSNNIDLKTGNEGLQTEHSQKYSQNRSGSGKIEHINQYGIQTMSFDAYFQAAVERQLQAWWAWARQGKAWSFAMDSAKTGNTTLDAAAAAGQKVIPVTATAGFSAGDECLIRAEDSDNEFEIVIIASISAGMSITATDNLIFSYTSSDIFRHREYWPSLIILDKKFQPEKTGTWYGWKFKFAEVL